MKKLKIFSILVALVLLASAFVSCGASASKTTNCTLSLEINGEYVIDCLEVPVKSEGDAEPVVLDALKVALDYLGYDYELSSTNLKRVLVDGVEYSDGLDATGENLHFWNYTANGVEPENGSASVNVLNEKDFIVFKYETMAVEGDTAEETEETEEPEATEDAEG